MSVIQNRLRRVPVGILITAFLFVASCAAAPAQENTAAEPAPANHAEVLQLPELTAVDLGGEPLHVVATTSIIGDVVAQVGGDAIALTTLMAPGQDPHSYEPSARDLTAVAEAHVIFVNGWGLEEALVHNLAEIGENVPIVAISANIQPLTFGEAGHEPGGADPHVWTNIHHVEQWVRNVENVFSNLDPAQADTYASLAAAYLAELESLNAYAEARLALVPLEKRFLVTNHDSFSYFAQAYNFDLIGTVIPAASTLAEPSASDLAELIAQMETHEVCAIFTETTVGDGLAQTVTAEVDGCDEVRILPIYTGALGTAAEGTDSYIGMMRANIDAIVAGLE